MISTSKDDGQTWSPAVDTDIPNPGSSLETIVLADGRWLMAYNDTEKGRHSFALSLSNDQGKTWKYKRHLELTDRHMGSFSYPSMIQTADGLIHVTYSYNLKSQEGKSIKHVTLNTNWVLQGN